ncbi:unnamed protein product [Vitrella brassicaformis CCMP3155]|uniref:Uncharacterized protein n=1 Tax=Vitrella brassicaformis (strain CCMP3155) TaxID=1169540 RepID=A0A0G4ENQ3_VITBC|nr:unnamed protein product [Vitrella brassicaformis CCMP3155]|eukprot:CEL99233.1 unnamed protein product [Vitrella brassicaformis CCMP3155]
MSSIQMSSIQMHVDVIGFEGRIAVPWHLGKCFALSASGEDCYTGASFVGRTNEISRLQTAATHSNNGVSGHLSLVQQNVQQAKSMMDASSQMSQASSTMAANALQAINNFSSTASTAERSNPQRPARRTAMTTPARVLTCTHIASGVISVTSALARSKP